MIFKFALALFFFTSYVVVADNLSLHVVNADPQPIPNSTATPNVTSSTAPPTTSPTTTPTTLPTTSPTTPPTTSPTTPSTPPPTTPTTAAPTTAPTAAPTTPAPTSKDWVVKNATSGEVCIIANMAIKIDVPYHANNKNLTAEFEIKYDANVTASGTCGNETQTLVLSWGNGMATFEFGRKGNASYCLHSVAVVIDVNNSTFPNNTMANVTKITFVHDAEVFSVAMNHSYTCASVSALNLNGTAYNKTAPINGTVPASLSLSKIHAEAFGTQKEASYSAPLDCAAHETPDAVPIVVGCLLFGLVIVVLIAYLVGRRRALARGYLSM